MMPWKLSFKYNRDDRLSGGGSHAHISFIRIYFPQALSTVLIHAIIYSIAQHSIYLLINDTN